MPDGFIEARLAVIEEKLNSCKDNAVTLREAHLSSRLAVAREREDEDAIKAITRIIHKERYCKRWAAAKAVFGKPRMKSPLAVQTEAPDGAVALHDTQEDLEHATKGVLDPRFRLSTTAPIFSSPLLEYTGILGEKPAVQQMLRGTFRFPPGTDPFTMALIREACELFQHTSAEGVVELVQAADFQQYWKALWTLYGELSQSQTSPLACSQIEPRC